jgi:hypothetical protein
MYVSSENNNIVSCLNYTTQCVHIHVCVYIDILFIYFFIKCHFPVAANKTH